ncbi:MAG: hypothetical protein ACRD3E_10880 [Terriglobales bacterium]
MLRFLISTAASLLPERYRSRWSWAFVAPGAAITCGAIQFFAPIGEVVPTLPLQLISMAHSRTLAAKRERELGPPVPDLVQPGSGDFAMGIASCRPKTWTPMTTISFEDRLYELVREESAQPPRRWVYVLRKRPESKVVRGAIYHYSPDEVLPKTEAATTSPK